MWNGDDRPVNNVELITQRVQYSFEQGLFEVVSAEQITRPDIFEAIGFGFNPTRPSSFQLRLEIDLSTSSWNDSGRIGRGIRLNFSGLRRVADRLTALNRSRLIRRLWVLTALLEQ